jgi:CubicO group peptidase (beta-lactamase class C family)
MQILRAAGGVLVVLVALFAYTLRFGGLYHPPQCTLFGVHCPQVAKVEGTTSSRLKPLVSHYQQIINRGDELESCFVVYSTYCILLINIIEGNHKLVDLCAGNVTTVNGVKPFRDVVQNVFSSTKNVVKIVVAMLVDRGLIDYDEPVAKYWPEFAAGKKEAVTVSDMMCHASGITLLDETIPWKIIGNDDNLNELASYFAKHEHNFGGKRTQGYHAILYGTIINELVRRVDPQKRTIAQFATQEIIKPLNVSFYFGLPESVEQELYTHFTDHPAYNILIRTLPKVLFDIPFVTPIGADRGFFQAVIFDKESIPERAGLHSIFGEGSPLGAPDSYDMFHSTAWRRMEHATGANGFTNAEAIAKMGQIMISGNVDGIQFLKPETIKLALTKLENEFDVYLMANVTRTKGGFAVDEIIEADGTKHEILGWAGFGGSVFMFDPKEELSFGYVPNQKGSQFIVLDVRAVELMSKFYDLYRASQ